MAIIMACNVDSHEHYHVLTADRHGRYDGQQGLPTPAIAMARKLIAMANTIASKG